MVLQREARVTLWGRARPGAEITVAPSWGAAVTATAGPSGDWRALVETPAAGGPHTLTFSGDGERTLRDLWSGEVWLCSGQSNMEWTVEQWPDARPGVPGAAEEIAAATFPQIRLFEVPKRLSNYPRHDVQGQWKTCSPQSAGKFSATAYYFGRKLHRELGVPVGLVVSAWGGTPVEAWASAEALKPFAEYAQQLEYLAISVDPNLRHAYAREHGAGWWEGLDRRGARPVAEGWTASGFDDAAWTSIELPSVLAGELGSFDGVLYLRSEVELPRQWEGKGAALELGPIDDRDDAWFDGVHVGAVHEDGRWNEARRYALPAGAVKAGRRAIAVRLVDTGGPGGVHGDPSAMRLRSEDASLAPIPLHGTWRFYVGPRLSEVGPIGQSSTPALDADSPSVLYNGMIAPLLPLTFRGAIWYQGEANVGHPELYARSFPALIADWRARFGNGEFPFYYVQIAPFAYRDERSTAAAELRDAQRKALMVSRNTAMAVTLDIGDAADIHPGNKQEVGRRLALLALAGTYGRNLVSSCGPLLRSLSFEGGDARASFDHADGGLQLDASVPGQWWIAGSDRRFHEAQAGIEGDAVVLSSPGVARPVAVRYAFKNASRGNLTNGAKLPASSFRSDDWQEGVAYEDSGKTRFLSSEPGFVPLFDGRDLDGWVNVNCAPSTWRAVDGRIACSGVPTGILRTVKQYENFVLELEWRHLAPQGNAGLFVWSDPLTARGQPFSRSVEVQVMTGMQGEGYTSDGDVFPIHGARMTPLNGRGGSSRAFPTEARVHPGGEWNHYRVTCQDGALELAVNGKTVTRGKDCSPRKGYLCLESEGTPAEFRNLAIKELPPSSPAIEASAVAELDQGFRSLYNGVDFSGWRFGPEHEGHWRADDWTIKFDGQGTHLWSEEEFGDFVLIADWRWSGPPHDADLPLILPNGDYELDAAGQRKTKRVQEAGDSGIYLRGNDKSQVNIWCWPIGSGEVYGYRTDAAQPPEVRAGVTPRVAADAPLGDWNRFVITLKGDRLSVVLNGQLVVDQARLPGVPPRGRLALQQHGSPIEFANLFIKPLDR